MADQPPHRATPSGYAHGVRDFNAFSDFLSLSSLSRWLGPFPGHRLDTTPGLLQHPDLPRTAGDRNRPPGDCRPDPRFATVSTSIVPTPAGHSHSGCMFPSRASSSTLCCTTGSHSLFDFWFSPCLCVSVVKMGFDHGDRKTQNRRLRHGRQRGLDQPPAIRPDPNRRLRAGPHLTARASGSAQKSICRHLCSLNTPFRTTWNRTGFSTRMWSSSVYFHPCVRESHTSERNCRRAR